MGNQKLLFLSLLALFFLQSNTSASKAAGFEASSEFSYDPCSPLGPQNWGTLHPSWANCTASPEGMQSPISIKPSNIYYNTHLSRLDTYYTDATALLLNYEGHEIRVSWTQSPGHLRLHDKFFHLRQCHWHAPSEHELFGKRYPLELHMVHTTSDSPSEIAVIGVLFEYGDTTDPFLDKLCEALNKLKVVNSVDVGSIHPPRVGDEEGYFRYVGSLTTPPCSEPVIWTVIKKVRSVSEHQVNRLRDLLHDMDNARPTQPINGRHVNFSHPHPHGEQKEEGHASS